MNPVLTLAGFAVGIVVGLTGMGGGSLMTPVLVLFFGVPPLTAVSSDLVANAVMNPFGGWVHARHGTVRWALVRWLCVGSVPSAFLGVLLTRVVGHQATVQHTVRYALASALLLAAAGLLAKTYLTRNPPQPGRPAQPRREQPGRVAQPVPAPPVRVRRLATVLLGAAGGLVVGLTSVGAGSLIMVALLVLYPSLRPNDLVGTDLVQAVPLVVTAALGHALFGDPRVGVAAAIVVGSIPGVLLGARLSSRAPAGVVRVALTAVLTTSALKLYGAPSGIVLSVLATALLGTALTAVRQRLRVRDATAPGERPGTGAVEPAN
ncbi:MAG TPA: sulfite exporter TauE/SafE family protein [Micromonosporaceae bacterium]